MQLIKILQTFNYNVVNVKQWAALLKQVSNNFYAIQFLGTFEYWMRGSFKRVSCLLCIETNSCVSINLVVSVTRPCAALHALTWELQNIHCCERITVLTWARIALHLTLFIIEYAYKQCSDLQSLTIFNSEQQR